MHLRRIWLLAWAAATGLSCDGHGLRSAGGDSSSGSGGTGGSDGPRDAAADFLARDAVGAPEPFEQDTAPAVEASDGPAGSQSTDGGKPRGLSIVLDNGPWSTSGAAAGMAVDSLGRVFVGDDKYVYVVDGIWSSVYLTAVEAAGPTSSQSRLGDLDIGPKDELYVATSGSYTGIGQRSGIVKSSAAHQAEWWVELPKGPQQLAVSAGGTLAMVTTDGLWTISPAGPQLVYPPAALRSTEGCDRQDLAVAPSGVFLYQPGCHGYPLLRGHADGTGVGVLYTTTVTPPSAVSTDNFLCSCRDPSGGFYILVDDDSSSAPRLYHVAEDPQGTAGPIEIQTTGTFAQAKRFQTEIYGFDYCLMAAARDGNVYIQTAHQLWRVWP